MQVWRGAYIPYFVIIDPVLCCPLFFEEYLNLQVRINKMVNAHTVNYKPFASELTSRIRTLSYLYRILRGLFLQNNSWIFSNLYISPWLCKSFKFMVFRLLGNTFLSQKMNLIIFTHAYKQKSPPGSYHHPQAEESYPFPITHYLHSPSRKERGLWSWKIDQN